MKISISFPPLESNLGVPLLSQNRQFQWFNKPTYIYPMVPAYTATLLKGKGHDVSWDDAIAEGMNYRGWLERILVEKPDIILIETKTPVVKRHWKIIDELKEKLPSSHLVLCGDHITAFPDESFKNSSVDFVFVGGDYDFICLNLIDYLEKKTASPGGVAYRENGRIKNAGFFEADHGLENMPFIDRSLTRWDLYAYENGNFKFTPGTYTMFGRDCWWRKDGGCTFCSWTNIYRKYRVVPVDRALDEVGELIDRGFREIFDDTGTFPVGSWLKRFCEGMISRGYNKKIVMGCNMRPDALSFDDYRLIKKAGFRLLLFGLESANQETLNRINKGARIEDIVRGLKDSGRAGLEGHITAMIGYPWETPDDARNTINLAKNLFKKGHISTLQATIVIPYPGTKLYDECVKNGWLSHTDYSRFDQRSQVMKSELTTNDALKLTRGLYRSFLTPGFILRKLLSIRSLDDIKFYFMAAGRVFGHLKDFSGK